MVIVNKGQKAAMCKKISPSMALGFALQRRSRVSFEQLLKKSEKLLRMGDGYLLDVSHRSIAQTVDSHPDDMMIKFEQSSFFVIKRQATGRMFRTSHLKMCYEEAFTESEFKSVIRVLMGS